MPNFVRGFALLLLLNSSLLAQPGGPPPRPVPGQLPAAKGDTGIIRQTPNGYVLDFQDQDIRVVLSAVAEAGDLNITFSNLPTRRVTLRMGKAVTRDELMDVLRGLAESNQLRFVQNGEFIRIEGVAPVTAQQMQQQQQQAQAAFAAQNQLRLYTYRLKHVSASSIAPVLMGLILGTGIQRTGGVGIGGFNPNTGQPTFQVTPNGIINIPNAIQVPGGRGAGPPQTGRGNAVEVPANAQNNRALEQLSAMTEAFATAAGAGNLRNQILQGLAGQQNAQQQQTPAAPGTLSAVANEIRIVSEESTNSLLIRATAQDYAVLTQLIQTVDLRPLQVLIEVTIAEVQRNKSLNVGISGNANKTSGKKDTAFASFPSAATARDFVLLLTGGKGSVNYDVAISALQSRGDVRVLSMPIIIAQNNKEAILNVGSQRPFVQVSQTVPNDPSGRVQTVQYVDVGKVLTITPTINADGYVNLAVQQTDNIATNEIQFDAPVISKREATTQVFLRDGQTTVIGGLADNDQRNSTSGIPFLSRIPFIGGWLFGNKQQSNNTSELFLFLTPHIISDDADIDRLRDAVKDGSELLQDMKLDPRIKLVQPPVRVDTLNTRPILRPPAARTDTTRRPPPEAIGDSARKIQVPIKRP